MARRHLTDIRFHFRSIQYQHGRSPPDTSLAHHLSLVGKDGLHSPLHVKALTAKFSASIESLTNNVIDSTVWRSEVYG